MGSANGLNTKIKRRRENFSCHSKNAENQGQVNVTGHYFCIMENVVYCLTCTKCPSAVYIGETGRRLADRFREHRRDVINGRNDLPVPAHFNQANHARRSEGCGFEGRPSQPRIPEEAGDAVDF